MNESTTNATFDAEELNFDDFQLNDLDSEVVANKPEKIIQRDISFFKHIPVTVTLEVASKEVSLGELMQAGEGTVIELDKLNGEPLDVKVNGSLMGQAEVVVVNDKYGLRLIEVYDSALDSVGH
ncbi:flagellar motor switch protein FliN [Vibrio sagamiensis]|uniref:Flagellar motor switch protein FliN n=1 Tax=Vibrio sagamiensis NBRC 104589 TaxID=1219064 RepID=A0A511QD08_9VIBR|nr:flagellar motor switch protein FliN [Vibrio sagamiensis]PNQ64876.1 flagellar motor switch protein FliN [Vibrio agarivorans]GEM75185.1 flagellar motor switch protein FliN [Vibrio sagamiensis NBRC 104589]